MKTKLTIFAAVIFFALTLSSAALGQERAYLSQSYIDTTVMRAILILNESSSHYSAASNKQNHAVKQSREVLENLKKRVKGDPNEPYALMKIREVEAQIYLEEEEMRKIAEDKRILSANQLVFQYNAEVGKMRPDFALLRNIHMRMADIDRRQANNLAVSYNRRYKQISREAQFSLEKALASNDAFIAKQELEYCERNKFYLMISSSQLERQRARFEKLNSSQSGVPDIKAALDAGEQAFNDSKLSVARTNLVRAQNLINDVRAFMPAKDGDELAARCTKLFKALDTREDSLVQSAINRLESDGPDAAYEYLQDWLHKRHNISHARAAFIDQAIMNRRPERAVEAKNKVAMIEAPTVAVSSKDFEMFSDMQSKARVRAQERADSLRAVRAKANGISVNIYTLLEQNKVKDAKAMFDGERPFLAAVMDSSAFEMLEMSIVHILNAPKPNPRAAKRREQLAKREAKEQAKLAKIEAKEQARQAKIDKKDSERQAKIDQKEQARLAKSQRKGKPSSATAVASSTPAAAPPASAAIASAPAVSTVSRGNTVSTSNPVSTGNPVSTISPPTAAPTPAEAHAQATFAMTSRVTSPAAPAIPSQSTAAVPVRAAPPTPAHNDDDDNGPVSDKNRQMALDISTKIYSLVEQDDIIEAHKRFQQYKRPLQKYMDAGEYQMLEFMVVQSYNYVIKR